MTLLIIAYGGFLADFTPGSNVITVIPQAA